MEFSAWSRFLHTHRVYHLLPTWSPKPYFFLTKKHSFDWTPVHDNRKLEVPSGRFSPTPSSAQLPAQTPCCSHTTTRTATGVRSANSMGRHAKWDRRCTAWSMRITVGNERCLLPGNSNSNPHLTGFVMNSPLIGWSGFLGKDSCSVLFFIPIEPSGTSQSCIPRRNIFFIFFQLIRKYASIAKDRIEVSSQCLPNTKQTTNSKHGLRHSMK